MKFGVNSQVNAFYKINQDGRIRLTTEIDHPNVSIFAIHQSASPLQSYSLDPNFPLLLNVQGGDNIWVYAMLLPQASGSYQNGVAYYFGYQTGKDFDQKEGAWLGLTPTFGPTTLNGTTEDGMDDWDSSIFPNAYILAPSTLFPQSTQALSLNANFNARELIEQNVMLMAWNNQGYLCNTLDLNHNVSSVVMNLSEGCYIGAFIKNDSNTPGVFNFEIGDPEKDGKVTVDEV